MSLKKKKNFVCIIPARSGSQRLKNKNIRLLGGKPLLYWTIKAAQKAKKIDSIFFTSNNKNYLNLAKKFGIASKNLYLRKKNLSSHKAKSEDVILDLIQSKNLDKTFTNLILLQVTSPLRTHMDISLALKMYEKLKATSLVSTVELRSPIVINKKKKIFVHKNKFFKIEILNGAIYIVNIKKFLKNKSLYYSDTETFLMTKLSSIDIDDINDFKFAQIFFKK